ncbi:MAG: Hsp20/alpha crystallin family protein [Candidatus Helarchaeota archaeon]
MSEENKTKMNKDKNKNIEPQKDEPYSIKNIILSIGRMINESQKKIRKTIENIKNFDILSNEWLGILSMLSNPISLDFLIDGIPKVFYDVFDYENDIEVIIDIPNISKEDIQIKVHYKTIKIYVKNYLIERIDLSKYLKRSIKVKNVSCQYEGRILKINIKK